MARRPPVSRCCSPDVAHGSPEGAGDDDAAAFRALGDPSRLAIARLIASRSGPLCVCEIVTRFRLRQPTISHHLKVLREAGLVSVTRRGVWAHYEVRPEGIERLIAAVSELAPPSRKVETS